LIEQAPKAAITQSIVALADALCGDGEHQGQDPTASKLAGVSKFLNLWPQKVRSALGK
jgi:hypothetical protein